MSFFRRCIKGHNSLEKRQDERSVDLMMSAGYGKFFYRDQKVMQISNGLWIRSFGGALELGS
jgi:hypothetical protein